MTKKTKPAAHWQVLVRRYQTARLKLLRALYDWQAAQGWPCYWYHIRSGSPLFWLEKTQKLAWCELEAYLKPTVHVPHAPLLYSLKLNGGSPRIPRDFLQSASIAISWELARQAQAAAASKWQDDPDPRKLYQWATSYQHLPTLELTFTPEQLDSVVQWSKPILMARSHGWPKCAAAPDTKDELPLSTSQYHRLWTREAKKINKAWMATPKLTEAAAITRTSN